MSKLCERHRDVDADLADLGMQVEPVEVATCSNFACEWLVYCYF